MNGVHSRRFHLHNSISGAIVKVPGQLSWTGLLHGKLERLCILHQYPDKVCRLGAMVGQAAKGICRQSGNSVDWCFLMVQLMQQINVAYVNLTSNPFYSIDSEIVEAKGATKFATALRNCKL